MAWGSLANITFQTLKTPNRVQSRRRWRLPAHRLINAYPVLEHQGEDLHTLDLSIVLNKTFLDPGITYAAFVTLANSAEAHTLTIGTDYWGTFAIQEISKTLETTTLAGEVIQLKLDIKLIEARQPEPLE